MKTIYQTIIIYSLILLTGCREQNNTEHHDEHNHHPNEEMVHLTQQQFNSLEMKVGPLKKESIGSSVSLNGTLAVPPQNQAIVTPQIGATVNKINVIEGDKVTKGQVLAQISHPSIIELQSNYLNNKAQLDYLKNEYTRVEKLYKDKIASGKEFQKIQSDFKAMEGKVKATEASLQLIGINPINLNENTIQKFISITSPISGYVQKVSINIGQYIDPQTEMFHIINNDHIHADFIVYEKDLAALQIGDSIHFTISSRPDKEFIATIFAIGKNFDNAIKAVHVHAEISNKEGLLLPGMYVIGEIHTLQKPSWVVPEDAIAADGDEFYIFTARLESEEETPEWGFNPIKIVKGTTSHGKVEIKLLEELNVQESICYNNAYYLISEMKKSETEHSH